MTYILRKGVSRMADLKDGLQAMGMGVGNIYYVMQTAQTAIYPQFEADYQGTYGDSSAIVHNTIQSALDATVAERNDYVIVYPDAGDYDITAALTMTKRNVHLICPGGLGGYGFPTNAARIHQTTDDLACITVTADCVEIAGFFFKGDEGGNIIDLSGTRWHTVIHDNYFGIAATASSDNFGIYADGACSHFSIYGNNFTNYSPGAMSGTDNDVSAFISIAVNSSTRGLIRDNIMHTGGNTAVATAINAGGYGTFIIGNYIWEDLAFGATEAGTLTVGINTSADCMVADNRIGIVTAANAVVGGTADSSYVENYEGSSGGTLAT